MIRYLTQEMLDQETIKRTAEYEDVKADNWLKKMDPLTNRRSRKRALGEWTDEDEKEYINKINEIKESFKAEEAKILPPEPYKIVSQEEYDKIAAEVEAKKEAEIKAKKEAEIKEEM